VRTVVSNGECTVSDGVLEEIIEWSVPPPIEGATLTYEVSRHLDTTQRIILVPPTAT
jgi:hypothetical protein